MTLQESILGTLLFFCCVLTPTVLFPISLLRGLSKEDPIISNSTLSPALHTYPTDNSPMDSSALGPAHISSTSGLCISILIGLPAFFFFFSVTASPNYPMCHHCQSYHHKGNLYSCHCLLKDLQFSPPPTELRAKLSV